MQRIIRSSSATTRPGSGFRSPQRGDGAPLFAMVALHPGSHPGVVVVHGFNTHGYVSVVRWAALVYARG